MAIQGKQKNVEVEGKKFLIQHPGILKVVQIQDVIRKGDGGASTEALYKELLEHCVFLQDEETGVPMKLTFDYVEENFSSVASFTELMGEATEFLFQ